uniref:hypothetical protein n=1 Tax=Palleronia sp. TaxID=1940284 RepID=UPI0035C80684
MTILRPVFLSLLCLAVLPWAAFARHMPTPGAGTVVAASTVHRAERPCRGASLPGSSCAPEAVLASAAVATTARVAMSI